MWRVWRFLRPFYRDFAWFVVLMVLSQILGVINGYRLSFIIDNEPLHRDDPWFWALFFAVVIVFDLFYIAIDLGVDWHIVTRHDYPIDRYARLTGMEFLMKMDPAWHEERESGTLVGRVNNGVDKVGSLVSTFSWEFIPAVALTIVSFVPLKFISPESVLASLICLPLFVGISIWSNQKRSPLRNERNDLYDLQWALMQEMVQSIETLRAFGQVEEVVRQLRKIADKIVEIGRREFRIATIYNGFRVVVLHTTWVVVLFIWLKQMDAGQVSVAQIVFANGLFGSVMGQIWKYATLLDRAFDYGEPIKRYLDLLLENVVIPDTGRFEDSPRAVLIEFRDVSFAYGGRLSGAKTINHMSFQMSPGARLALVGPSGGGKTTVMKVMMRSLEVSAGAVLINGVDTRDWRQSFMRRLFAYIPAPSRAAIFSAEVPGEETGTIEYNILIGSMSATHDDVVRVMRMVGMHEFVTNLPMGYKTRVGERGVKLSSGQIQRILIARGIIAGARVLVMDEPTSNIDSQIEAEIMAAIQEHLIQEGISVLTSAHRLSTTRFYDKILVIVDGKIAEGGSHEELLGLNGVYARLWNEQMNQEVWGDK